MMLQPASACPADNEDDDVATVDAHDAVHTDGHAADDGTTHLSDEQSTRPTVT